MQVKCHRSHRNTAEESNYLWLMWWTSGAIKNTFLHKYAHLRISIKIKVNLSSKFGKFEREIGASFELIPWCYAGLDWCSCFGFIIHSLINPPHQWKGGWGGGRQGGTDSSHLQAASMLQRQLAAQVSFHGDLNYSVWCHHKDREPYFDRLAASPRASGAAERDSVQQPQQRRQENVAGLVLIKAGDVLTYRCSCETRVWDGCCAWEKRSGRSGAARRRGVTAPPGGSRPVLHAVISTYVLEKMY